MLAIVYNGTGIKQYGKRKYLGCILEESLSGESMALNIIDWHKQKCSPAEELLFN